MRTRQVSRSQREKDKQRKRQERQNAKESLLYHPASFARKQTLASELNLPCTHLLQDPMSETTVDSIQLCAPKLCYKTMPDGNCFFNALSYAITGSENFHFHLRQKVCEHLLRNSQSLSALLPLRYTNDVEGYLESSNMRENHTWATEVEIFCASSLLHTDIYVYTKHGVHWKWLKHSVQSNSTQSIYLYHKTQNHYDVVLDVEMSPVLQQFPSNLHYYFADQLQRDRQKIRNSKAQIRYQTCLEVRERRKKSVQQHDQQNEKKNQKKTAWRESKNFKYHSDEMFREQKKRKQRETYHSSRKCRERKKALIKARYSSDANFRQLLRHLSSTKYSQNKDFRDKKKKESKKKYRLHKEHSQFLKEKSKREYRNNPTFQQSKIQKSKQKYRDNKEFQQCQRERSKQKYRNNKEFKQCLKERSKQKYRDNKQFQQYKKERSKQKYRDNKEFRQCLKEKSKQKYRTNKKFRFYLRVSSVKKYHSNPLFRAKLKAYLKNMYSWSEKVKVKKKQTVKKRRNCITTAIKTFKKCIGEIPKYSCTVCGRILYRKQVKCCKRANYMDDGVLQDKAAECLTGRFIHSCESEKCKSLCKNRHAQTEWICHTCHRHLIVGNMPPQAIANGLDMDPMPHQFSDLNGLERQLVALRIPFMKLLSLPRGGQKGVKGQVVNVPSDLNSVTKTLPRTINEAQMVRVKLKRKLSYKGHHQYEWVNPDRVVDAVKYLIDNNSLYTGIHFKNTWFDTKEDSDLVKSIAAASDSEEEQISPDGNKTPRMNDDSTAKSAVRKMDEGSYNDQRCDIQSVDVIMCNEHESTPVIYSASKDVESVQSTKQNCHPTEFLASKHRQEEKKDLLDEKQSLPVETCFQPLDIGQEYLDTNDKIFCLAPGEGQRPQSVFQEKGADVMAFPALYPSGRFGLHADRTVSLSPSKYFGARLFAADDRFARSNQFIFFAQYFIEMNNIKSNISVALRKGKSTTDEGQKITSSMITSTESLRKILKADTGFRFLQPVRGSPPYWQRTMKDLYAMIRQLGIPTWFVTFSAGETRWEEVILALSHGDKQNIAELEWNDKSKLIRENPVMCARLFSHRVNSLFTELILSSSHPIGHVVDYFYRTEFQQRGSPHIHCLIWIKDAPKLDENLDDEIAAFVDEYISCELPDKLKDPELYEIVSSVQMHSKTHTKSCKKNSSSCRFHFPRPPILKTFVAHAETEEENQDDISDHKDLHTSEQVCEIPERSAKTKIRDVWKVLNSLENPEKYRLEDIMHAANLTYTEFEESLKIAATKNSIYHKRGLTDMWVNNYNEHLLHAWGANLDIQFVMDAYSCVAYIISYISKAEAEVGELLSNAKKEAKEGNKDAADAMKYIGQAYIQNREVSAQEAVYRICGMHLKECSRKTVFVPTGNNPLKMSLPISILKSRGPNSENVWMTSIFDKYMARPVTEYFEKMFLARFCSDYAVYPSSRPPRKPRSPTSLQVYELQQNMGYIKQKKKGKENIVRYPRFSRVKDPDNYYMTLIQLYLPHRRPVQKPQQYMNYEEYIRHGMEESVPIQDIIMTNRHGFEMDVDDLEKAWDDVQDGKIGEEAWANLAPGAETERLETQTEKEEYNTEDPIEEGVPELELEKKSKSNSRTTSIQYVKPKLSKQEIQTTLRSMNPEQMDIFYKVRDWALNLLWNNKPEPFHLFVTGGAGTGKSHLIKGIFHETSRILSKVADNPDNIPVLLTAPTGTAAFNIGGTTIHSALAISKSIKIPYTPLGENILNTLRTKLDKIQLLIIDEVSMVDHKLLTYIHGRLCQIKHSKKPFGNVSILAVGDFYQLPPVRASPLYKLKETLFLDLWNPLFHIATLTQVMRQKEDACFAMMLNRLRTHERGEPLLQQDSEMLDSAAIEDVPESATSVLHIFPTNKEVTAHNNRMVSSVCSPCLTSLAKDYNKSTVNGKLCLRQQPYSTCSAEDLPESITLGVGARIMLIRNLDTEDGLVNGAFGTIKAIDTRENDESRAKDPRNNNEVTAVYVRFDNPRCGRHLASKTVTSKPGTEGCIRIVPVEDPLHGHNAIRKQLPLRLGWAATIHKIQGMTAKEIVVSLKNVFQPGMAYVALSRATSLKGLHIINLDKNAIYSSQEIKKCLEAMPAFIQEKKMEDHGQHLTIALHNTEGLLLHKDDIQSNDLFTGADVVCFTETWLNDKLYIPSTLLPDFQVYTSHRESSYSTSEEHFRDLSRMAHGGVAMFLKRTISKQTRLQNVPKNMELLIVRIEDPLSIIIATVYRPPVYPANVFERTLNELLSFLEDEKDTPILVVGDLNDNMLAQHPCLANVFFHYGYRQWVQTPTTESGSCLDVVWSKNHEHLPRDLKVTVLPLFYGFHDALKISISLPSLN